MNNENSISPSVSNDSSAFAEASTSPTRLENSVQLQNLQVPVGKKPRPQKPTTQQESPESGVPSPRPGEAASNAAFEDPFSSENLLKMRLPQDFASMAAVRPVITTIAVTKPNRHEFIRVRGGPMWRFETGCFVDKSTKEIYLITPNLMPVMPDNVTRTALVLAISRSSPVPFLWPLTLPNSDGRPNRWHESAIEAARLAEDKWLRCASDMRAGCYVSFVATGNLPEPEWPADLQMHDYLRLAFQDRLINDISHICLKRLRGEI